MRAPDPSPTTERTRNGITDAAPVNVLSVDLDPATVRATVFYEWTTVSGVGGATFRVSSHTQEIVTTTIGTSGKTYAELNIYTDQLAITAQAAAGVTGNLRVLVVERLGWQRAV